MIANAADDESEHLSRYDQKRSYALQREQALVRAGQEIGPLPPVEKPRRRAAGVRSFKSFCKTYFPSVFALPWSDDHLKVIRKVEDAVLRGELFAMAMPRGSGKTSICERAVLWAAMSGRHRFIVLIGPTKEHADSSLDNVKSEIENNDLLLEDFPEVCFPIRKLEGSVRRCEGQRLNCQRTQIVWTTGEVVLPTVDGAKSSSVVIRSAGLTSSIRGMNFLRPDGESVRPSLVLVDDPQTDESAWSPTQCQTRERILAGAVLGLAGPGKKIAGLMPCTVVRSGDMADRMLDRSRHPEWKGERTKMIYSWPERADLWDKYAELRRESLANGGDGSEATQFYRQNRKAMDAGAVVSWPARKNSDELSAVQCAWNLRIRDEASFFAEYQNEPKTDSDDQATILTADEISKKVNGYERHEVPLEADKLTAFIDVQQSSLWYVVAAWSPAFTGYVVDYGTWPKQSRRYYTLSDIEPTLQQAFPSAGIEGQIYGGLDVLVRDLMSHRYLRDDGAEVRIDRLLIDANWGTSTDTVYQFCRQCGYNQVVPGHGRYVGASSQPFSEYKRKRGDVLGHNWRIPAVTGKRAVRHVLFDSNYWKSFIHARLAVSLGDRGCLSLWKARPAEHQIFGDHLAAEYPVTTSGRGRTVDEWKIRPERPDNHFLDCITGTAVAASMIGVGLPEQGQAVRQGRPRQKRKAVHY